jgi:hypothetical protein
MRSLRSITVTTDYIANVLTRIVDLTQQALHKLELSEQNHGPMQQIFC